MNFIDVEVFPSVFPKGVGQINQTMIGEIEVVKPDIQYLMPRCTQLL
jgi:hypothetical protein